MSFQLVIAEKPSVARSNAAVIGATEKQNGYWQGGGYLVSWCIGHLVSFAEAGQYDEKYCKWKYEDLPILPQPWQFIVPDEKKQQFEVLRALLNRPDVDSVPAAPDAGREGELIFRLVYEQAGCRKPMKRLWISSMEESAIRDGFENLKPGSDYDSLYQSALCRQQADGAFIKNEYEDIEIDSQNQIASLQKNGKKGVYDLLGNMILPIQYDDIIFAGKCINASKDGKLQVFDLAGVNQSESSYRSIVKLENTQYSITINKDNQYGVIDSNKVEVIENKYSYIEYAFDNYFVVSKDGMAGLINTDSKEIIPVNKNVVQNIKGTKIIQTIDSKSKVTELYNNDMQKVATQTDARIYIKDNYVEMVSKDNIEYFDFDGNKKEAKDIFDNKIYAKEQNGKWGYVDKNGNEVVAFIYDMTTNLNKYGYGAIKLNDKWGVIDQDGNVVKEPTYELTSYEPNFIGEYYEVNNAYQMTYFSNETK